MPNLRESGIRNPGNFCLWNLESNKFLLRNPECWKIYESGIREIFASQSGILGFGIWNTAQGIRNPTNDSNPESASSIDKVFGRNPANFFSALRASFWSKKKGEAGPPGSLPWIRHCKVSLPTLRQNPPGN